MTPYEEKRPLPSSTSLVYPECPNTHQQWKMALQRVKILYLRGQWKQCATSCSQLLLEAAIPPQALHATYLHFFCAISNETIARLAHPLSASKLQRLEQAKASYEAAASSLPMSLEDVHTNGSYNDESWTVHSSSSSNESEILDYYQSGTSSPSSPSSVESVSIPQDIASIKPSPLHIRKSVSDSSQTSPTLPRRHHPSIHYQTNSHATLAWTIPYSLDRYNHYLVAFTNMLAHHILTAESLIRATRESQAMRYFAKRLVSYDEDEAAKVADLKGRIAKLKAKGWRRERFRPERYEELCERALSEL